MVLETCAATHPKRLHVSDLKMLCKASLILPLQEYLSFLLRFGYLKLDLESQLVAITLDAQRLLKNPSDKLVEQAEKHFRSLLVSVSTDDPATNTSKRPTRRKAPGSRVKAAPTVPTEESFSSSSSSISSSSAFISSSSASISSSSASISPLSSRPQAEPPESFEQLETSPTPTSPLPFEGDEGTIGGRYQTVEMLGKGSVGTVFLARQIKMGREVAVKEMNGLATLFPKPLLFKVIRRFAREMTRIASLSHPNIGVILDGNALKDQPYVVFEYLPGGSLQSLLADNEYIPPETAIPIFLQCLNALRYALHRGVQHRNLKPSNILFDDSGNVRIVDFGMIPVMNKEMKKGSRQELVSTSSVGYIPPEVLADPGNRNESSDLYALGMILYEMLAGRLPGRRSPMPTDLWAELPPIVDELFDRLTHDNPAERFATADEVLESFHCAEGFEALVDPSSAVLFWDIAPEEDAQVNAVQSSPEAEVPVVGIGRIKSAVKPLPVTEIVRDDPPPPVAADIRESPVTTEVWELPPDNHGEVGELEPSFEPQLEDPGSLDLGPAEEGNTGLLVPETTPEPSEEDEESEDNRRFLETPAGIRRAIVPGDEDSLEIEVDVQDSAGQATFQGEEDGGLVWEEGEARDNGSGESDALSWEETGELNTGGLEVTVSSSNDEEPMELMSPSEPVDQD